VPRLVHLDLVAARKQNGGDEPPALILDRGAAHALRFELADRGLDVVAHQVELVETGPVGRMDRELGGREREDRPAVAGLDLSSAEHPAEEPSNRFRFTTEDQCMHAGDHDRSSLRVAFPPASSRQVAGV
jgi:hypothetical protein